MLASLVHTKVFVRKRKTHVRARARSRGLTTVETVLATAAVMGCFVYPLSLAMRSAGARVAAECERAHEADLEQTR